MKEIRLHGRGGLGVVKASQLVVRAAVEGGLYGQSIPAFGVERKGSPVFGYLRLSHTPIRRRMQVYTPDILLILDDSLITSPDTYAGLKDGGMIIINTKKAVEDLHVPKETGTVVTVDATTISEELLGRNMPNTAMLGAYYTLCYRPCRYGTSFAGYCPNLRNYKSYSRRKSCCFYSDSSLIKEGRYQYE